MLIRTAKRIAIAVIGGTVVLLGIILIVLPGPAVVVIPAGLAILATEFAWAKWMLKRAREQTSSVFYAVFGSTRWCKAPKSHGGASGGSGVAGSGPASSPRTEAAERGA